MIAWRLVRQDGGTPLDLPAGLPVVLGRGAGADLAIQDPTISRRHAELVAEPGGVRVRDLGSSNGVSVNGARVAAGFVGPGDTVAFGKIQCRLEAVPPPAGAMVTGVAGGTIVRQLRVEADARAALAPLERAAPTPSGTAPVPDEARRARKLAALLDLSQRLAGELDLDRLLATIVEATFEVMPVDRASILLVREPAGELVPRLSRSRLGDAHSQQVPRSIAERVVSERIAVLSDNAAQDARFSGQSILMQSVRSAMCTPLMAEGERVLGILYVDSVTATHSFGDEDLQFLVAFAGIAAAGIRTSMQAEQLRREALVRGNFERYFAPDVASQIARSAGDVRAGGERRPITVLFSDIRGFTSLAETMAPEAIAELLSEYFSEMVDIVFEHGGTLDKFIGDAIMALWGAPLAQEDGADRAMRAATAMQWALRGLNQRWADAGRPVLEVGIGVSHGEVFAGNIGSDRRLEYTVIGDTVNIAARLCSEAGPGEILASGPLRAATREPWPFEALEPMALKGKAKSVEVFRVRP